MGKVTGFIEFSRSLPILAEAKARVQNWDEFHSPLPPEELTKQGLMQPAGLASFEKRVESRSKIYSYEKDEAELTQSFKKQFKANKKAWEYFQSLAPSYRKVSTHWVMSAKQESTKIKRLNELIADSARGTNKWKDNKYNKK